MLPELGLSLLLSVMHAAADLPPASEWPASIHARLNAKAESPVFRSAERAVSNWRKEALWSVTLPASVMFRIATAKDVNTLPRCVKLNNYWCIKKAGWNGEIAADAEGHVAFASALEGATVAALLLRRYYVDFGRHSSFAIVSRWAPAQCGLLFAAPAHLKRIKVASAAASSAALREIAPSGIQNTLRARWLAGHGRGGVAKGGKAVAARRSVIPNRSVRMMPAPEIAVGMGEHDIKLKPLELSSLVSNTLISNKALGLSPSTPPVTSCAADGPRIDSYAKRAADGVANGPNDDLKLFTEDGAPTPNLAKIMRNMASVEIGPLAVHGWLIDAGIAEVSKRFPPEKTANRGSAAQP